MRTKYERPPLKEIEIPICTQDTARKPRYWQNINGHIWQRSQDARETPLWPILTEYKLKRPSLKENRSGSQCSCETPRENPDTHGIQRAALEGDWNPNTHVKYHKKIPILTENKRPLLKKVEISLLTPNATRKPRYSRNINKQPRSKEIGIPMAMPTQYKREPWKENTDTHEIQTAAFGWDRQHWRGTPLGNPDTHVQTAVFRWDRNPNTHAKPTRKPQYSQNVKYGCLLT